MKLEGNRGLQERCLRIADRARLILAKLRLPALGAVLIVHTQEHTQIAKMPRLKAVSSVTQKFLVRRARVRDDSAGARRLRFCAMAPLGAI